jgi:hypothetical protein
LIKIDPDNKIIKKDLDEAMKTLINKNKKPEAKKAPQPKP